jgi:hypothetical protein
MRLQLGESITLQNLPMATTGHAIGKGVTVQPRCTTRSSAKPKRAA